jgi:hypothetical protein
MAKKESKAGKSIVAIAVVIFALVFSIPAALFCSQNKSATATQHVDPFNESAKTVPDTLLFRIMQNNDSVPGVWKELSLNKDGYAFSGTIMQGDGVGSVSNVSEAILNPAQVDEIKRRIATLRLKSETKPSLTGRYDTVIVFFDGKSFKRVDLSRLPSEISDIMDFINAEIQKKANRHSEEIKKR